VAVAELLDEAHSRFVCENACNPGGVFGKRCGVFGNRGGAACRGHRQGKLPADASGAAPSVEGAAPPDDLL
jgi:hypothetical protein